MAGKYFAWPWKIQIFFIITYKIPDEITHTTFEWFLLFYVGECTKTMLTKWYNSWEHTLLYCMYYVSNKVYSISFRFRIFLLQFMWHFSFKCYEYLFIYAHWTFDYWIDSSKKTHFYQAATKNIDYFGEFYLLSNSVSAFYLNIIH